jgi:hypothetical protein
MTTDTAPQDAVEQLARMIPPICALAGDARLESLLSQEVPDLKAAVATQLPGLLLDHRQDLLDLLAAYTATAPDTYRVNLTYKTLMADLTTLLKDEDLLCLFT